MEDSLRLPPLQALTFVIDSRTFGFDVLRTREVLSLQPITAMPNTPGYIAGVLNLRGTVLPVIELRLKFGLPVIEPTPDSAIVVIEKQTSSGTILAGVIVDAIRGVLKFGAEDIQPAPHLGEMGGTDIVRMIGRQDDKFVLFLDIDLIVSDEDLCRTGGLLAETNGLISFV